MKPLFEAMVSFHKALGESPGTKVHAEIEASSKKRKWEEPFAEEFFKDQTKSDTRKPGFNIDHHLQIPFPSDKWRQYLSIQTGQTHFGNPSINRTTTEDSKRSTDPPPPPDHSSLDLELNLTCESLRNREDEKRNNSGSPMSLGEHDDRSIKEASKYNGLISSPSSWLSSDQGDHKEMVATVCMRCHMLVMLCKSSPSCPNCKFMHPPDQNPSKFLKRKCSLFC